MKTEIVSIEKVFEYCGTTCKISFEGPFIPSSPGVHTLRNGDPGYPPEPAEFTINKSTLIEGDIIALINTIEDFYDNQIKQLKDKLKKYEEFYVHTECFSEELSIELGDKIDSER